jgi:hypothetical protein
LNGLVRSFEAELSTLKTDQAEEVGAIRDALQRAVSEASKLPEQRKKKLLSISASGLKDAAGFVAEVAPKVLATATLIADFVHKLHGQ